MSEESLTIFVIGVAVIVTMGPLFLPPSVLDFCKTDLFAVLVLGVVVFYGRLCKLQTILVVLGVLILYVFLSTFRGGEGRESFCPNGTAVNMFGLADSSQPIYDCSQPPDSSSAPPRCNYSLHPELRNTDNVSTLGPPAEWLTSDCSAPPPEEEKTPLDSSFDAYDGFASGADFNASFQ